MRSRICPNCDTPMRPTSIGAGGDLVWACDTCAASIADGLVVVGSRADTSKAKPEFLE